MSIRTKIRQIGNSLGIIIPKKIVTELGLKLGDELFLTRTQYGLRVTLCRQTDDKTKKRT